MFLEKLNSFLTIDFDNHDDLFVKLMRTLDGDCEIIPLLCDYINDLFDIREKYMLPVISEIVKLRPVCTRSKRVTKIPEYLNNYVC